MLFIVPDWQENASQEKLIEQTRMRAKIKAELRGQYGGVVTPRARSADGGEERGQIRVIKEELVYHRNNKYSTCENIFFIFVLFI